MFEQVVNYNLLSILETYLIYTKGPTRFMSDIN